MRCVPTLHGQHSYATVEKQVSPLHDSVKSKDHDISVNETPPPKKKKKGGEKRKEKRKVH
jgi:hypothetical protein